MTRAGSMREADFQKAVTDLAELYGWSWAHFRPAQTQKGWRTPVSGPLGAGWPDLVLARERDRRTMFIELKTEDGHVSPAQHVVLALLEAAGLHVDVWKPHHLDNGRIMADLR